MKILLVGDVHWSEHSSIVRGRGAKYSVRLENLIRTVNWCEELSKTVGAEKTVYMGDFFDRADLNAQEITALKEVEWSSVKKYFIVGNHEIGINNLEFSSAHLFDLIPNATVVDMYGSMDIGNTEIVFLPYILESDRKPLISYLGDSLGTTKRVILSHNDIKGVQMGGFISKTGFDVDEIEANCDLFINGHLHNGCNITNKIINIGNITGQNFSENAELYTHKAIVLDVDTLTYEVFQNPFAFNFYKIEINSEEDINKINPKLNSVVTIKCPYEIMDKVKDFVNSNPNIVESRVIMDMSAGSTVEQSEYDSKSLSVDHLESFKKFFVSNYGNTDILLYELNEVTK